MKILSIIWVLASLQGLLFAQSEIPALNRKFGKPTAEEMRMTQYPLDTVADAVYLLHSCEVEYTMSTMYDVTMHYAVKFRIKVLKEDGKRFGDIEIPYYNSLDRSEEQYNESIEDFSAVAYNYNEQGKIVASKVVPTMIFDERLDKNYMIRKVSVPQVRQGTIIECKYNLFSPIYFQIDDYVLQRDIPIIYTNCHMEIPAVLEFNVAAPTSNPKVRTSVKEGRLMIQNGDAKSLSNQIYTNIYDIEAFNMPAIREDDYVWCPSDYCARVECDLKATHFPNVAFQAHRRTWEEVDDLLLTQDEIGSRLNDKSKLSAEIAASGIAQLPTLQGKVQAAIHLLHDYVAWNGDYSIVPQSASSVLKKKSGTTADLNMMLINMLNDLGIKSSPVFLSTRHHGILPIHPSVKSFNTMIVAVDLPKGQFYVDATRIWAPENVLVPNYYVKQARLVSKHRPCEFVDLSALAQARTFGLVQASLSADGTLTGDISLSYYSNSALDERMACQQSKDSADYVNSFATKHGIEIKEMKMTGFADNSSKMVNSLSFQKSVEATDDHIYLNPFVILPMGESPFKSETRELPIELPYRENQTWSIDIAIPEGYVIEELPKGFDVATPDRSAYTKFRCLVQENHIRVSYSFVIKDIKYSASQYSAVKAVYDNASQRINNMIILKKQ